MRILNTRPVAHAVHNMNNDYDMRVPATFQHLAILGLLVIFASTIWMLVSSSNYGITGIIVGIVLLLPTALTLIITRSANNRRFRIRDGIVHHAALKGDEKVLDVGVGSGITLFGCAKHLTTGKGIGIDIYASDAGGGTPEIFWKNADKEGCAR